MTITSINPSTGETLQEVPTVDKSTVEKALKKAHETFATWKKTSLDERVRLVKKLRAVVVDDAKAIARLISQEQGKSESECLAAEVISVLDTLKYLEKRGKKELKARKVNYAQLLLGHKKGEIRYEPYGVISVISPWNFPFCIPFISIIEAVFAGNTVVLKPSPFTVLAGQKAQELFDRAGFPEGVVQTVICEDSVAPVMTDNPYTRKIIFTGSVATGKKIMQAASKRLIPVVLELGGKDPAIVTKNANLKRAASGIVWGSFMNSGQVCASLERVYIEKSVYEPFVELLKEEWKHVQIPPMIHHQQKEIVVDHLKEAKEKGAKVLCGGDTSDDPNKAYVEPTILEGCNHNMSIMNEETFGPVCCLMPIDSLQEAIELSNDSEYGLNASLWSDNAREQEEFFEQMESGSATVNDCLYPFGEPSVPWGGRKASGVGRTHSHFGLMEMVQPKYISRDKSSKRNFWWYPYDEQFHESLLFALKGLYHQNYFVKIKYTIKMVLKPRVYRSMNFMGVLRGMKNWF